MERQVKALPNGPVAVQVLSNGPDNKQPLTLDEGEEVKEVAILEKKLEDLKSKNDVSVVPVPAAVCGYISEGPPSIDAGMLYFELVESGLVRPGSIVLV